MADKDITVVKTDKPNVAKEFAFTSLAASDNVKIPCSFKDEHTMLLFRGGSAEATVTLKAGDGYGAVNDLTFTVGASKYMAITINSARFKVHEGDNKGLVIASVSAACSIAVVEARV